MSRLGDCVLTAPTAHMYNGLPDAEKQIDTVISFIGSGWNGDIGRDRRSQSLQDPNDGRDFITRIEYWCS